MLQSIIGNIQALEAIKITVGIDNNLSGKLLIYNILTHQITKIGMIKINIKCFSHVKYALKVDKLELEMPQGDFKNFREKNKGHG